MRFLTLIVLSLMVAIPAIAGDPDYNSETDIYNNNDTTRQDNQSINAPTSAMSNVQINPYSNARDYFGDGVSCAKPSVNLGLAGGERPHRAIGYVNVNIPLGGDDCKKAASTRTRTMEYALHQMQTEQGKADKLFAAKMANMCLDIQSHISIHPDNPLFEECSQYIAIEPTPDEIAHLSQMWNDRANGLTQRVNSLEQVAHLPNETNLLWQKTEEGQ